MKGRAPFARILDVVRRIPRGKVANYGLVAEFAGGVTPRHVGWALAGLRHDQHDVPWQRVVNVRGGISLRDDGLPSEEQRVLLEAEGVRFLRNGCVDLARHLWRPRGMGVRARIGANTGKGK